MRVMLDGFALAMAEGTGLTTYSRQVGEVLTRADHELTVLYSRHPASAMTSPSSRPRSWRKRFELGVRWLSLYMPGGRSPACIPEDQDADIPAFFGARAVQIPDVYRAAMVTAALSGRPLSVPPSALVPPDVFHCTSPLPVRLPGVAQVTTLHDLIPLTVPGSSRVNPWTYRRVIQASLRGADRILAVSRHAQEACMDCFGIAEERFIVTYQSVAVPAAVEAMSDEMLAISLQQEFGLEPEGYFLFCGAMEPKKNLDRVIDAALLKQDERPLVIVSDNGWSNDMTRQHLAAVLSTRVGRERIRRHGFLPRESLMRLMRGARALVFPSLAEGFGLPALEAMQLGTPVITSRRGALVEVGGDAAFYVDPVRTDEIADAMDRIGDSDSTARRMAALGHRQAARFSPDQHRRRLESAYRQVIG